MQQFEEFLKDTSALWDYVDGDLVRERSVHRMLSPKSICRTATRGECKALLQISVPLAQTSRRADEEEEHCMGVGCAQGKQHDTIRRTGVGWKLGSLYKAVPGGRSL